MPVAAALGASGPSSRRPRRPGRGLRLRSWREAEFASLDFETTGLDYGRDAVVSFGVVPVRRGRVAVGEAVHQLVVPEIPSSPSSMKIHRIMPQDLADAAPPDVARDRLRVCLENRFLLAWFAQVEIAFLTRMFGGRARPWARRTVDVRELAIELEGADPRVRYSLTTAAERYGVPVANPHEALDDAMVTAQLFLVLATRLEAAGKGTTRSLLRLTRG
ncbi:MAG TPA: 3'-5' exonuclease [Actinomycetota bacterium]|nr:3'-5' exonuclease [Actinomycetota bacterium]